MTARVLVRPFQEADRAALRQLYVASRDAAFPWNQGQHRIGDFEPDTEGERLLVALIDGQPLGFVALWEADSFVHHLFVHPDWLRQGIGRALLAAGVRGCRGTPTLKCLAANTRALQFYQAQGWAPVEQGTGPQGPYWVLAGR